MEDLLYIQEVEQAKALLKPVRMEILTHLAEPGTCTQLAEIFGESPQKIYYHVKILEKAGLVEKVEERRVRGTVEGIYQAKARSYWLSPEMVAKTGGPRKAREQMSLGYLLSLAEELQADIAALASQSDDETPALGLSTQIELAEDDQRAAFMQDVQSMFQALAVKYGRTEDTSASEDEGQIYRLKLACYPPPEMLDD